jgi:hypothetical protein
MYTDINFKSKKALKEALAAGKKISIYSPGPFPAPTDGRVSLEGPHYPEPHKWYAQAFIENGFVKSIK